MKIAPQLIQCQGMIEKKKTQTDVSVLLEKKLTCKHLICVALGSFCLVCMSSVPCEIVCKISGMVTEISLTLIISELFQHAMKYHWGTIHDDVIKWKHFPRYWPFVWEIHRSR